MPTFETFECSNCGAAFEAVQGANAAESGYCTPACEREGKGLV